MKKDKVKKGDRWKKALAESIKGSLLMNFLNSLLIGLTVWREERWAKMWDKGDGGGLSQRCGAGHQVDNVRESECKS